MIADAYRALDVLARHRRVDLRERDSMLRDVSSQSARPFSDRDEFAGDPLQPPIERPPAAWLTNAPPIGALHTQLVRDGATGGGPAAQLRAGGEGQAHRTAETRDSASTRPGPPVIRDRS